MLSGTASWLSLTLIELFGFECKNNNIYISPIVLPNLEEYSYTISLSNTKYKVIVKKQENGETVGAYYDNEVYLGYIKRENDEKEHTIKFVY